jgi:hypothetical protein
MTLGANIIANGDAELDQKRCSKDGTCTAEQQPRCWSGSGCCAVCYNANGYPNNSTRGPPNRGGAFFTGGSSAECTMQQSKVLPAALAGLAAKGLLEYSFSAYLGGWDAEDDASVASVQFVSQSGAVLDSAKLGPVLTADRESATALLPRSTSGLAPIGTYAVCVQLTATQEASSNDYNNGFSDALSLAFTQGKEADPPALSAATRLHVLTCACNRGWGFGRAPR